MIDLTTYSSTQVTTSFLVNWLTNAANDQTKYYFLDGQKVNEVTAPQFFNHLWNVQTGNDLRTVFYSKYENAVILKVIK